jgi:hypothetical protein
VVTVSQIFLYGKKRLYDYVFDVGQDLVNIFALLTHFGPQTCETPFMPSVICNALSLFELSVFFVQRIVGQMDKHVFHHFTV